MSLPRLTIARGLLVALAVVLAGRAVWQASRTEVGWEVVLDQWLKTPAAAAGLEHARWLADPQAISREIDAQIAAVRSDSRLMDELREKVEAERLRSLATPRRRR